MIVPLWFAILGVLCLRWVYVRRQEDQRRAMSPRDVQARIASFRE